MFTLEPTDLAREQLRDGAVKAKIMLAYTPEGQTTPQRRTADVTLPGG
jgi:hypothetical protein